MLVVNSVRPKTVMRLLCTGFASTAISFCAINTYAAINTQDTDGPLDHVSCTDKPNKIRVTITNVKESIGLMTADLYPSDTVDFLEPPGRTLQVKFAAKAPSTEFCLYAPSPGDYSIAVYHDENANGKFDKGAFGIPVEPWSITGNPRIRFSAPPIEKTLFTVPAEGASVSLKLRKR